MAYAAMRGGKGVVVADGMEGPVFDGIVRDSLMPTQRKKVSVVSPNHTIQRMGAI